MGSFLRELSVAGATSDLPGILEFVTDACAQGCIDPGVCFDVQLAVEEACANVIAHAYGGRGGPFSLRFEVNDHAVVITVHDQGRPFEPREVARPNMTVPLEKRPIGGLGLYLMYQLMDEVRFTFTADGNTVVMVKRNAVLNPAGKAPVEAGDG